MFKKALLLLLTIISTHLCMGQAHDTISNKTALVYQKGALAIQNRLLLPNKFVHMPWFDSCGSIWMAGGKLYYHDCRDSILVLSPKDSNLIKSWASSGSDAQTLSLQQDSLTILRGNTIYLPYLRKSDSTVKYITLTQLQDSLNAHPGSVVSVNGQTGIVSLSTTNIPEGSNLYFTDARVYADTATFLAYTKSLPRDYNFLYGLIAAANRNVKVDTTLISSWQYRKKGDDSIASWALSTFLTSFSESDPIANAHTVTIGSDWGLTGGGGAQALSTNPSRTLKVDSTLVSTWQYRKKGDDSIAAWANATFLTSFSETDPVATAKTETITTNWGLLGGGSGQTIGSNPAWSLKADSTVISTTGYRKKGDDSVAGIALTKQPQLNGTGFVKASGTTISYDNTSYYPLSNPSNYISLTALSSTATGLTYTNTSGIFSLTSGYIIPTTTEETNWNTAYTNRITSLTTTGSSGSATLLSNVLNIPTYTLAGLGGISLTSLSGVSPISYNNSTGAISMNSIAGNSVLANTSGSSGPPTSSLTYSSLYGTSSLVYRDANGNTHANNFESQTASIGTGATTLSVGSTRIQIASGTGTPGITLPDATTLNVGHTYEINNNATGTATIKNNGGTTLYSALPGAYGLIPVTSVGTSNGTWDCHWLLPSSYQAGTTAFNIPAVTVTANSYVVNGGTSAGFLKANGSIDLSTYLTTAVTSFSSGNLSPLFTTNVATSTTTPSQTFSLSNAAAHTFFGNFTGSTGAPSYSTPALASADFANQGTTTTVLHGNASGNPSWGQVANTDLVNNSISFNGHSVALGSTGTITTSNSDGTISIATGTTDPVVSLNLGHTNNWTAAINEAKGSDIASATTTDIGAATGNYINVTGTTTITSFGTVQAGTRRIVTFKGALTLTYNSTSMILPGSANITTAAEDIGVFVSLGSGNWKCVSYTKADGTTLVLSGSTTINGTTIALGGSGTVTAAAGTLTGSTLASGVTASSLTSHGTITSGGLGTGAVIGGVTMTLGSDANYDLYYRNSSGILTRLAAGTDGNVLTTHSTTSAPTWTSVSSGGVTSVGVAVPTNMSVSGTPVTSSGTITLSYAGLNTITDAANFVFNGNNGAFQKITLGASRTFTISNLVVGVIYKFIVVQDGTGSRALTWGTTVKAAWGYSGTPPISTTANAIDIYELFTDGTNIYAKVDLNHN